MTVSELKKQLEKFEKEGKGDCLICIVNSECEPISQYSDKFTTDDIDAYYDGCDGTITITN